MALFSRKRKMSRRNRNIITGLLIGAASLFVVVYLWEVPGAELAYILVFTLGLLLAVILLALLTIALFKGLGRLLSHFRE